MRVGYVSEEMRVEDVFEEMKVEDVFEKMKIEYVFEKMTIEYVFEKMKAEYVSEKIRVEYVGLPELIASCTEQDCAPFEFKFPANRTSANSYCWIRLRGIHKLESCWAASSKFPSFQP